MPHILDIPVMMWASECRVYVCCFKTLAGAEFFQAMEIHQDVPFMGGRGVVEEISKSTINEMVVAGKWALINWSEVIRRSLLLTAYAGPTRHRLVGLRMSPIRLS